MATSGWVLAVLAVLALTVTLQQARKALGKVAIARLRNETDDLFVCYRSLDAMFARESIERLRSLGAKVWFAEYQVLTTDRGRWEDAVRTGISRCRSGLIVVGKDFATSQPCELELQLLVQRLPPERIWVALIDPESEVPKELPSRVHIFDARRPAEVIARVAAQLGLGRPEAALAAPRDEPKTQRVQDTCCGISYSMDLGSWSATTGDEAGGDASTGLRATYMAPTGFMGLNVFFGPLEGGDSGAIELEASEDEIFDKMAAWAGAHFERYGRTPFGVHVLPLGGRAPLAVSYFVANPFWTTWGRKYSVVLEHPTRGELIEFAITFHFRGKLNGFLAHGSMMDRIVASLRWPDGSPEARAKMSCRAARLAQNGHFAMARELEGLVDRLASGNAD